MSQINGSLTIVISADTSCKLKVETKSNIDSEEYLVVSQHSLEEKILPMILKADPSIQKQIDKAGTFSWELKISKNRVTTNRLQRFVPMICYEKVVEKKLYNYQTIGVGWLLEQSQRILADDMGLGKTVQILVALQKKIIRDFLSLNVLLAPITLIKNWEREASVWSPNLVVRTVSSSTFQMNNATSRLFGSSNLILCPYSLASKLQEALLKHGLTVDQLICDEAHKLRKDSSLVNNAVRKIKASSRWLISGTPLERDEEDIANILGILFPHKTFDKGGSSSIILRSNLSQVTLRREKKDVLPELPCVEKTIHELTLSEEQNAAYFDEIKKISRLPSDQRISLITRLCIMTCKTINNRNTKIDRALSIIRQNIQRAEKTIIFSNFNEILHDCQRFLTANNIKCLTFTGELEQDARDRALNLFKFENDIYVLLLNSRVGGEGLTLTEANNVIFLNEWWNPSSNRQAEDRVNRIGQKKTIHVHILRAKGTIDEDVAKILHGKAHVEKSFLQALVKSVYE